MPRLAQTVLVTLMVTLGVQQLAAQEHKLGVNLRINGAASQVGLTWLASPSLVIRPSLIASWTHATDALGGEQEATLIGLELDFLFRTATWDRVTSYVGVGGSFLSADGDDLWAIRALLGARVSVIQRVALFGEVGLRYQDTGGPISSQSASLVTFPIGVVVFLK